MNQTLGRRSLEGTRRLLAFCREHVPLLRGFVDRPGLDRLAAVFEGLRSFDPADYTDLFNLFQILPEVPRPGDVQHFTLGDALDALTVLQAGVPGAFSPEPELALDPATFRALGHHENVAGLDRTRRDNLPGWQAHAQQHRQVVVDAVDRTIAHLTSSATPAGRVSRIAYLGAGRTYDVPVEALAERCDELVLVDVDERALEAERAALPSALAGRIRVVAADVTGLGVGLRRRVDDIVAASPNAVAATDALGALATAYAMRGPPRLLPEPVDVVVSGMLLSQLGNAPCAYPRQAVRTRWGVDEGFDRGPCAAAFSVFPLRIQQDHIAALAAMARAVVITTDVAEEPILGAPTGDLVPSGGERPTIGARRLSDRLPHWLEILPAPPDGPPPTWHWYRVLPRVIGGWGARLRVEAVASVLRPRK